MVDRSTFRPDWASAPGETIADILAERQISPSEFAGQLGHSVETVNNILQGRATITLATARSLTRVLGASVEFWISRDLQYRDDAAQLARENKEWLAHLPLGDMIRFRWLDPIPQPHKELDACLRFFGVRSVRQWQDTYANLQKEIAFRTSPAYDSHPGAVAAWIRQGEIQSMANNCPSWDATAFEASLPDLRALTRIKNPELFLPKLRYHCAKAGVAVSVVRAPTGCRASGATRFLPSGQALLLLSFRYLTDDHFWFTFFHEAGHLLLHGQNELFLEGIEILSTDKEDEANAFAARILVPPSHKQDLLALPPEHKAVIRFARRIGVSPGIIVGQMQHHRTIEYDQLNSLKRRYRWKG